MSHARCALLPASVLLLLALLAGTHMQTAGAAGTEAWRKQVLCLVVMIRAPPLICTLTTRSSCAGVVLHTDGPVWPGAWQDSSWMQAHRLQQWCALAGTVACVRCVSHHNVPLLHTSRHTGTWSGITSRLDYLEDLGMTAIWITPIVQQIAGRYGDTARLKRTLQGLAAAHVLPCAPSLLC